ncbi:MAG: hypothetical protein ABSA09_09115 [Desulfobaccales bacterium]|jgi:hypothetical protein
MRNLTKPQESHPFRKSVIILISLLLAFCLSACNRAPQPREFKSEAGRFSVMTPTPLEEKVQPLETRSDKIDLHIFSGQRGDTGYFVSYWDYPPGLVHPDELEKMLDAGRDGSIANVSGRLIREGKLTLVGNPGRELVIETGSQTGPATQRLQWRMFIVGNRMYQIMVVAPKDQKSRPEAEAFLQSLKLLGGQAPVGRASPPAEKRD